MYTSDALLDLHTRGHASLARLIAHCDGLRPDELRRPLDGFGYPTVHAQLAHVIGAEHYWIGVVHGVVDAEDRDELYPTTAALESWRAEVAARTAAYLGAASVEELNTPRPMVTWGGRTQVLAPARVVLRTVTHAFQHQGQVVAQCRLLGRPVGRPASGLDFPIT